MHVLTYPGVMCDPAQSNSNAQGAGGCSSACYCDSSTSDTAYCTTNDHCQNACNTNADCGPGQFCTTNPVIDFNCGSQICETSSNSDCSSTYRPPSAKRGLFSGLWPEAGARAARVRRVSEARARWVRSVGCASVHAVDCGN